MVLLVRLMRRRLVRVPLVLVLVLVLVLRLSAVRHLVVARSCVWGSGRAAVRGRE